MDKVRIHREMLKRAWLSIPRDEDKVETREIRITSNDSKDWFIVKIITDVKSYYASSSSGFNTLSEAMKYVKKRVEYKKYKLVINNE